MMKCEKNRPLRVVNTLVRATIRLISVKITLLRVEITHHDQKSHFSSRNNTFACRVPFVRVEITLCRNPSVQMALLCVVIALARVKTPFLRFEITHTTFRNHTLHVKKHFFV
jgi:hypothetical protein